MQIEERRVDGNLVIRILEERLGADKAAAFKQTIGGYLQAGHRRLILDFSHVEFVDSSGLGAILSVRKQVGGDGLIISGATEAVSSMFKLTRMDRVFEIYETLDKALAAQTR